MKRLPAKLNRAIAACDTNQSRLSRQTGLAQSTISDILAGKPKRMRLDQVAPLADALGLSLDFLVDDEMDSPPTPMTVAERQAIKTVRALGLSEEEVIQRLNRDPNARPVIEVDAAAKKRVRHA